MNGVQDRGNVEVSEAADLAPEHEFDSRDYLNIPEPRGEYLEIKNDQVVQDIGVQLGFDIDRKVTRALEKTSSGNIRYESVVILKKPPLPQKVLTSMASNSSILK